MLKQQSQRLRPALSRHPKPSLRIATFAFRSAAAAWWLLERAMVVLVAVVLILIVWAFLVFFGAYLIDSLW
jgi:hypothetical protein